MSPTFDGSWWEITASCGCTWAYDYDPEYTTGTPIRYGCAEHGPCVAARVVKYPSGRERGVTE